MTAGPSELNASSSGASEADAENFKVIIRVRPPLNRELRGWRPYQNTVSVDAGERGVTLNESLPAHQDHGSTSDGMLYASYRFTFDHVFGPDSTQDDVYQRAARAAVTSTLDGYNAAIIAYGQTGTGKTYTMEGERESLVDQGIVPRAIRDIFSRISDDAGPQNQYLVRASYLQIYNEVISDLLKSDRTNLVIREDRRRGVYVEKLSEWVVRNEAEILELMARGAQNRTTGATKLNDVSSRSHAVFLIIIEQSRTRHLPDDKQIHHQMAGHGHNLAAAGITNKSMSIKVGKLNLVDLAGSERVHITGATGRRLEESKNINQSLSALGNVITALTDRKPRQHIPYRNSKLTRILEDSLGGNCKTTMMCMISPALDAFAESVSTLKFANRAKNIRNRAEVNEDLDHRTLLRKYERELMRLRTELQARSQQLVDKRHLLQIDEQRRRAEADKLAAITELERRSREFMKEKSEKRALEQKIASLQGQLLVGGSSDDVTPAVRRMLDDEQARIRSEYEHRFRELERQRTAIEGDKAQVDTLRDLLLKQRDIMLALTKRLSDRDEQILTFQEELEAYDAQQRRLEDALDQKTAEVIALRKVAIEEMSVTPGKVAYLQSALGVWGSTADVPRLHSIGRAQDRQATGAVEALNTDRSETSTPSASEAAEEGCGPRVQPVGVAQATAKPAEALQRRVRELEASHAALQQENELLKARAKHQGAEELDCAKQQLQGHQRERKAMQTILETKMKSFMLDALREVEGMQAEEAKVPSRLIKSLGGLHRLIDATVQAMVSSDLHSDSTA